MSSNSSQKPFNACDKIAGFYEKLNVPSRKTEGILGGKSYTWYVDDRGQSFQIRCHCSFITLGFGALRVESRMSSQLSHVHWFKNPEVDFLNAKITMKSPIGAKHELRLPIPDSPNK